MVETFSYPQIFYLNTCSVLSDSHKMKTFWSIDLRDYKNKTKQIFGSRINKLGNVYIAWEQIQ